MHAFPLSKAMWEQTHHFFSKNFQVISLDLPGFGYSPEAKHVHTMDFMAEQVEFQLSKIIQNQKIVLSGISMGGYVGLRYFKMFPEKIRALGLISTRALPDSLETKEKRKQNIALIESAGVSAFAERMIPALLGKESFESDKMLVNKVREEIIKNKPEGLSAALRGMAERFDSTALLSDINCPVLVLSGEEDSVIPSSEMEKMAHQLRKADFRVIKKAGHLLPLEQSNMFHESFLSFLKKNVL
ncbi:MAG: alpha/beta fold hydrolase [Elusimicrobiota bacterium]